MLVPTTVGRQLSHRKTKNKSNTTRTHASLTKNTFNIKATHKKLKPGLVASYDILHGNGTILVELGWKSKKTDEASKKGKVKDTKA